MQTLFEKREIYFTECAVFRIPTQTLGDVFMRAERPNYDADRKAVVEVDAVRFLNLWRQPHSSHREIALGDPGTWSSDYKYRWADDGFSKGAENPVPLAEVNCGHAEHDLTEVRRRFFLFTEEVVIAPRGLPWLSFTNGITRTIWLLANGAPVFPVECSLDHAQELQRLAGVEGGRPVALSDLIPERVR
ncbi:plasmid fertility inhibition factor family protein [Massilia aurea]|uniref:plasmid fertility inhibition factor family protein n=1 Tax=Massilia aurea TaxID=373040 RepID=UPI002162B981|nr:hypothetical protein [Massilia aurea]MCS0710010.1 hypothetical protein [Massilia aurea]